jgi:2'-5' RNA ligase
VFLGEQPDEALPLLKDGLASLNKLPDEEIRLPIRGIEGMPNRNKPNSFHISLEDPGKRLAHQKKMLEDYLVHIAAQSAVNWKPEDRSFTPHLTLGYRRKKADPAELGELLTLFGLSWQALVPELRKGLLISPKPRLFQSTMLPEGPQYQLLA